VSGFFAQRGFWIVPFFIAAGALLGVALIWAFLIDPELSVVDGPQRLDGHSARVLLRLSRFTHFQ
jgi:hypothetical protein